MNMGHNAQVPRAYCWLPDTTLELAKATMLIMTLDGGNVTKYAGNNLGTTICWKSGQQKRRRQLQMERRKRVRNTVDLRPTKQRLFVGCCVRAAECCPKRT